MNSLNSKKNWHAEEFRCLVALGESTTAGGWSTSPERCWVAVLGGLINDFQETPARVVNSGIGANLISTRSPSYEESGKPAASERLEKHVLAHDPDLLIISYGLNDARGGTPLPQFREDLAMLVRRVRVRADPLILLTGPYFMTDFTVGGAAWSHANLPLFKSFNAATAEVAEELGCLYADLLEASGEAPWTVHYDGVHQNDLGHRLVANRLFEVLARNCSCLAKKTREAELRSPSWRDESTLKSDYGH